MLCAICGSQCVQSEHKIRVKRGRKDIRVKVPCWQCVSCRHYRVMTDEQTQVASELASQVWQEKYSEAIPEPSASARIEMLMRTKKGRDLVGKAFRNVLEQEISKRKEI